MADSLDAEFAAATARVNTKIDRMAREALWRLERATPGELADGTRKHPFVEMLESLSKTVAVAREAMTTIGNAIAAASREG